MSNTEQLAYDVHDARKLLGDMSHSTFYRRVNSGAIPVRKDGKRTLVLASDLERYLETLPSGQSTPLSHKPAEAALSAA
jgi:Helix-turn-helix domain